LQSKKLAAIGIMASGVAHEINNPLNNIQISAQVLKRQSGENAPPEVSEIVDDIIGQTARLKIIVGNLLEFARERELNIRPVELGGLIRDAYSLVGGSVDTSGVEFSLDSDPGGVMIKADYDQLQQVFVNLFSNAVAAMNGSGRLMARIASENGDVDVLVADTGPGIPEDEREKVFDPFFTRKEKGTGLGLAIVMNTMIKHGGWISVIDGDSTPGAVFKLTFPKGDGE
jgi:two-component system NtrC family sensor kinase